MPPKVTLADGIERHVGSEVWHISGAKVKATLYNAEFCYSSELSALSAAISFAEGCLGDAEMMLEQAKQQKIRAELNLQKLRTKQQLIG